MSPLYGEAIAKIKGALAKYPDVRFIEGERSVKIAADDPNGFEVELIDDEYELTVVAGPYHTHMYEAEDAANAFLWMLTPAYRVVEELRGKRMRKALLQREENGKWETIGAMGCFGPFFGWKRQRIYRNRILPVPD